MKNKIVYVNAAFFHPPWLGRLSLARLIASQRQWQLVQAHSLESLTSMDLSSVAALVLYVHQQTLSAEALSRLDKFVGEGGGLLGVHSATASFKTSAHYFEIIGGQFSGHGPVQSFTLTPTAQVEPAFAQVGAFTVTDELYLHDMRADVQVQFESIYNNKPVPVVWTRGYGEGRVCYACPGHRSATMTNPAYREVIVEGLRWVVN